MNQTTAAATPPFTAAEGWTTGSLVLIAIFAIVVVLGILYGAKLKRQRRAAEKVEELAQREAPTDSDPAKTTIAPPPGTVRAPVAPPPPPLDPTPPENAPTAPPLADEPIVANATPEASPTIEAADGPVTQLKGLGPKVAARLAELGVTRVGQVAALTPDAAEALDAQLGAFRGRMERDRWIEQARFLAAGDVKGFEAVFGKL